jgi:hypothetical protein
MSNYIININKLNSKTMKKLFVNLAIVASLLIFASCTSNQCEKNCNKTDSTSTDSVMVDSVMVDSAMINSVIDSVQP